MCMGLPSRQSSGSPGDLSLGTRFPSDTDTRPDEVAVRALLEGYTETLKRARVA